MTSSSPQVLPIKRKVLAAVATLAVVCGVGGAATGVAIAASPQCADRCISVFSSELGSYDQLNFVEAILGDGGARIGQPVGLKRANKFDPTQDIKPDPPMATVADFFAAGMVSAEANQHYGHLQAVQQRYAPFGIDSNLCVGLASVKQNEGLTLQPFTVPGTTVWVVQTDLAIPPGYSPIINAATTDFRGPFSMHLPRNEVASGKPLQMQARHLQFLTGENTRSGRGSSVALWIGELVIRVSASHEPPYYPGDRVAAGSGRHVTSLVEAEVLLHGRADVLLAHQPSELQHRAARPMVDHDALSLPGGAAMDRDDSAGGHAADFTGVLFEEAVLAEVAHEAELLVLVQLPGVEHERADLLGALQRPLDGRALPRDVVGQLVEPPWVVRLAHVRRRFAHVVLRSFVRWALLRWALLREDVSRQASGRGPSALGAVDDVNSQTGRRRSSACRGLE
jgi:hypothetical protein